MRLLGIDLETTGLNPETDKIIELGFQVWDVYPNYMAPVYSYSALIRGGGLIPENITALTGITDTMRSSSGTSLDNALKAAGYWCDRETYLVAHNAEFEKSFLSAAGFNPDQRWLDTMTDIDYKPMKGTGSLNEIAMAHGIFNPQPHRALPDVMTMMAVLQKYDINQVIEWASTPSVTLISQAPFDLKDTVKAMGYRWDRAPFNKLWTKQVKAFHIAKEEADALAAGFSVKIAERQAV